MSEQPPHDKLTGWVKLVQGLSLRNVLIIGLLVGIAIPSYALWKMLNDPAMLSRYLSSYEEIDLPGIPCVLRMASPSGDDDFYSISTGFAFRGSDRYQVTVLIDRRPTDEEVRSYCTTLTLIADKMLEHE